MPAPQPVSCLGFMYSTRVTSSDSRCSVGLAATKRNASASSSAFTDQDRLILKYFMCITVLSAAGFRRSSFAASRTLGLPGSGHGVLFGQDRNRSFAAAAGLRLDGTVEAV